jgi:hypothetical protein
MRKLGVCLVASLCFACSDDGVAADGETQAQDTSATADDGDSMTSPSASEASATDDDDSATDPSADTQSDNADDAPGSSDDGGASTTGPGSDGTTGNDGSSSDTGPAPAEECVTLADCVVVDDCCSCLVIHEDEAPPDCDIEACLQSTCSALGLPPVAACELGSCELAPVPCNPAFVSCESLPPDCEDGFFPGVNPDSSCWTGTCVPAEVCDVVPACEDCPDGEACVQYVTQLGPQFHCSPVPESCDGDPSCACMAEACVSPFDTCGEGGAGISCSCPVCG